MAMEGQTVGIYASIADVRGAGAPSTASDSQITTALTVASSLIDGYTSSVFDAAVTESRTFTDIRTRLVVLPEPFSAVTSVSVSAYQLTTGQWEVESWGLRLFPVVFKDASGLPVLNTFDYSLAGPWAQYGQLGFDVTVAATWGWSGVPVPVQQSAILLALDYLRGPGAGMSWDARYRSVSVEGFSVTLGALAAGQETTGNVMADRMLDRYRENKVGVG